MPGLKNSCKALRESLPDQPVTDVVPSNPTLPVLPSPERDSDNCTCYAMTALVSRVPAINLTGVDLSPAMIEQAKAKKLYDRLVCADLAEFLTAETAAETRYQLVLAADVLVYVTISPRSSPPLRAFSRRPACSLLRSRRIPAKAQSFCRRCATRMARPICAARLRKLACLCSPSIKSQSAPRRAFRSMAAWWWRGPRPLWLGLLVLVRDRYRQRPHSSRTV